MNTHSYFLHIDYLRSVRQITITDFCKDICDTRTYRRYKSNERTPSQDTINNFCDKLELTQDEFYRSYHISDKYDYNDITKLYMLIGKGDLINAEKIMMDLNKRGIKSKESSRFLKLCNALFSLRSMNPSYPLILNDLKELINYPKCLEKSMFTFIEIVALNEIGSVTSIYNNDVTVIERLYDVLLKDDMVSLSTNNRYFMGPVYESISIAYGKRGEFLKSYTIALEGIKRMISLKDSRGLHNLYYLASLGMFKTGKQNEAMEYAKKCIATCIANDDEKTMKKMSDLFLKEQGIKISMSIQRPWRKWESNLSIAS